MSEQQPKFHVWFHKFLIFFFLWMMAAFAVLFGIRYIRSGLENGYEGFPLAALIAVNGLQILLGFFTVKVRFDLAALREKSAKEMLIAGIAGAVLCLANYWVEDISGDDFNRTLLTTAFLLVCWGIALYRYYRGRSYIFKEY